MTILKIGFDTEKYLAEQKRYILERVNQFDKLYLEFGGKIFSDMHAKRILPGFRENVKVELLRELRDHVEVIICIYAGDIERSKVNENTGISYDMEVFKLIDDFRNNGIKVNSVVITRYTEQVSAKAFMSKLERRGIKVIKHQPTKGYPTDVDLIVSDEGYGQNPYIECDSSIVVMTAPGPGNGKLATCLNQLYHEFKRGVKAGYSKFETFPVWNLPLKHPVNVAYEAATLDLNDINMIDFYHMEHYGEVAVNYNRDLETFPLIRRLLEKITMTDSIYKSPTDMGVNRIAYGIIDEEVVIEASKQEIIRRSLKAGVDYKNGNLDFEAYERSRLLMETMDLDESDRRVVVAAREKLEALEDSVVSVVAIELSDGTMLTGKESETMHASAAAVLNALKHLAKIDDAIHLLSPLILEPISLLKTKALGQANSILDLEEILIALSISAATNPVAQVAFDHLEKLKGAQLHSTTILNRGDENTLRDLGIEATSDAEFVSEHLFYNL